MKNFLLILTIVLGINGPAYSQLSNGSIAPNFSLTDRDGNVHNLYQYLDQGKVVFIKFFACHCPGCWGYHNTGKLETLHQTYGPSGTNQIIVLMLEHDVNNPEAFSGMGNYTQGDWEDGNSVPMIDVEGNDRSVFSDYNLNYYPMIMKICSDKTVELMSTSYSVSQLFQEADDCAGALSVESVVETGSVYVDNINKQLKLKGFEEVGNITFYNVMGQKALAVDGGSNSIVDVSSLSSGMYVVRLTHSSGILSEKILIE